MGERMSSKVLEKLYGGLERSKKTIRYIGALALAICVTGGGIAGYNSLSENPERATNPGNSPSGVEIAKANLATADFNRLLNETRATQPLLGVERKLVNGEEQNVTHFDGMEQLVFEVPEGVSADTLEEIAQNGELVKSGDGTLAVTPDMKIVNGDTGEPIDANQELANETERVGILSEEQLKKLEHLTQAIQKAARETDPLLAARIATAREELDQAYDEKLERDLNAKLKL